MSRSLSVNASQHRELRATGYVSSSEQSYSSSKKEENSDMSHSVTVTRTTTTTTTSAIIINTGYLKTWPGLLKLAELILGITTIGLVGHYYSQYNISHTPEIFFLLMAVTFMIGTFLLLLSCLISIATSSIISKTIHEVIYHGFAFLLLLAASLMFVIEVNHRRRNYSNDYEPFFAAGIIGLVNAGLYLLSTIFAQRSYRGL